MRYSNILSCENHEDIKNTINRDKKKTKELFSDLPNYLKKFLFQEKKMKKLNV